jgi:hypothetical protein
MRFDCCCCWTSNSLTYIHQPEETRGIDGDLEEGVYLTMVDGISDIMEDMEVSIICQQLYRAYVHTILIGIVINIMPSYPTTYLNHSPLNSKYRFIKNYQYRHIITCQLQLLFLLKEYVMTLWTDVNILIINRLEIKFSQCYHRLHFHFIYL